MSLVLLATAAVSAQTPPTAAQILKKVGETYRAASQYEYEATITQSITDTKGVLSKDKMLTQVHVFYKAPDKFREEQTASQVGERTIDFGQLITVDDGSKNWSYTAKANLYDVFDHGKNSSGAPPDYNALGIYRNAEQVLDQAKLLREERIVTPAGDSDCFVVAQDEVFPAMLWVDKKTYHILRFSQPDGSNVQEFKTIKLNEPIPDKMFIFEPPPGARQRGH